MSQPSQLPVVNCEGCGACCFHMGYPAYVLPRDPMTEAEIEADAELREKAQPKTNDLSKTCSTGILANRIGTECQMICAPNGKRT